MGSKLHAVVKNAHNLQDVFRDTENDEVARISDHPDALNRHPVATVPQMIEVEPELGPIPGTRPPRVFRQVTKRLFDQACVADCGIMAKFGSRPSQTVLQVRVRRKCKPVVQDNWASLASK